MRLLTSGVCWIESTEFLLAIDRVVVTPHTRNVVVVSIRDVPHASLPDRPSRGRGLAEADHQAERQQLEQGDMSVGLRERESQLPQREASSY